MPPTARASSGHRLSLDLFCRVIDNYGDAGVCWRIARQLAAEHNADVRLWIDHPDVLARIAPAVSPVLPEQTVSGVSIHHWTDEPGAFNHIAIPDVVIEGFGCRLPEAYLDAMAAKSHPPAWFNLEYLSAEAWVSDHHGMQSPQSTNRLVKTFLFPGFTGKTGGLFREKGLIDRRRDFQQTKSSVHFLSRLGLLIPEHALKISLFCYPQAPVSSLFRLAEKKGSRMAFIVPEGVASEAINAFFGTVPLPGNAVSREQLSLHVIPFMDQDAYDRLLWSCDLNFVRGEDSFMRAQWAARPFIWQIYPQDESAHLVKLHAFLDRFTSDAPDGIADALRQAHAYWNNESLDRPDEGFAGLASLLEPRLDWQRHVAAWSESLGRQDDFVTSLVGFIRSMG